MSSPDSGDDQPLYQEVSPLMVNIMRGTAAGTVLMVLLSFIFCLVKGTGNHTFYLLACNLIISSFVGIVIVWWYKHGDLGSDKSWFMLIVGAVIVFQCLTTDIFVFNVQLHPAGDTTTAAPTTIPGVLESLLHT